MTCSVLITNYNTWALTHRAVWSVRAFSTDGPTPEIIVVDDASENDPDVVAALLTVPNLRLHRNETNRGYVRSVNTGVGLCTSELILLLDSDAHLLSSFSQPLSQLFTNNPRLGAVGLHLVDQQGQPTGNAGSEPSAWTLLLGQRLYGLMRPNRSHHNLVVYSCGMAFRKAAFMAVGGFDERFDFLDADVDFSMTLRRHGWTLATTQRVSACHTGGGSPQLTSKRVVRFYKNRYALLTKYQKITRAGCFSTALLARLLAEYGFLKLAAPWLYPDTHVRQDKLNGRRALIHLIYTRFA